MSRAQSEQFGPDKVVILVKAAPQPSTKHQETVCTAGITCDRQWVRLFPIAFRALEDAQKFKRWSVVEYTWRKPKNDQRIESRRANQQSLRVLGSVPQNHRFGLADPMVVDSLGAEREAGRSFALIRPQNMRFSIKKRTSEEVDKEKAKFDRMTRQGNFFEKALIPYEPSLYSFHYGYDLADGHHNGTCQDWELEATFFNWRRDYGEEGALTKIQQRWGEEYPGKDVVFAMGTHSQYPNTWLINGVIPLPGDGQAAFLYT